MSFGGKKSSAPAAPTATFTPVAAPAPQQSNTVLQSQEAQNRAASPQGASSLLATDEEAKRREFGGMQPGGVY